MRISVFESSTCWCDGVSIESNSGVAGDTPFGKIVTAAVDSSLRVGARGAAAHKRLDTLRLTTAFDVGEAMLCPDFRSVLTCTLARATLFLK